jgi:hypothetical protein
MAMKALKLTLDQWISVNRKIAEQYPPSVRLVRPKMRKVLGFTPREHSVWINVKGYWGESTREHKEIHLDFYDEAQHTMFLLKYGDLLDDNDREEN